jgi:hypothetical protein
VPVPSRSVESSKAAAKKATAVKEEGRSTEKKSFRSRVTSMIASRGKRPTTGGSKPAIPNDLAGDDEPPFPPNSFSGGPIGHYGEAEEDAATVAVEDDNNDPVGDRNQAINDAQTGGAEEDHFDETGVSAFLDYQIHHARNHLSVVRSAAQTVKNEVYRADILNVVADQESILTAMEHLRQANIASNNATAALVRNLSASVVSAGRTVLDEVRSREGACDRS